MTTIKSILAREILDSRGHPTLEVELKTENGCYRAAVPSGASTGAYEAVELRDGDKSRYGGKGVLKAVENVNKYIAPQLIGMDVTKQEEIDKVMVEKIDGTTNEWGSPKAKMGANAILGVSMAVCRAAACALKMPLYKYIAKLAGKPTDHMYLPVPCFNVINGGVHAGNLLALQEFMIVPVGAKTFREAVQMGSETYQTLKQIIKEKFGLHATNVGDEGGVAPGLHMPEEALELLTAAIEAAGYKNKIMIGIDAAASECYDAKQDIYNLDFKSSNQDKSAVKTRKEMLDMYKMWIQKYPIVFYEDPFAEDDWEAFAEITKQAGDKVQIIGDDLLVTNIKRMEKAIEKKAANGLLLKLNQIGTVTEAIQACLLAHKNGWCVMTSHRSGETEDTFLADLSVGLGNKQLKSGALCRGERTCKYNQLMRIEEELGANGTYPGNIFSKTS